MTEVHQRRKMYCFAFFPCFRDLVDSLASTMHAYFVLHFPKRYRSPCTLRVGFCKALRCGHRNVQLSAHIFQNLLEFFVSGINEIPRNFQALSSFGFWIAHICLSLRFDASDIAFQISSQKKGLVWRSFALLSVAPRTRYIHPVVFQPIS